MLPYGRQTLDDDDIAAVVRVLRSDWLTQGPAVDAFEAGLCEATGGAYAVAVANGTAALHLAYVALGLSNGDSIVTTPITFLATANAARYCGAEARFADVDAATGNLDPASVESMIDDTTRGIVAVHLGGLPAPLEALRAIADRHGLWLVEDASHALGATYLASRIGDGTYCDAATFSFHPVKHVACGEGGAVTTNDAAVAETIARLRAHGVVRIADGPDGPRPWYYEAPELGWNYRLSDIHAALGLSQLAKQPAWLARRRAIADRYRAALSARFDDRVVSPLAVADSTSAYHLFAVAIDFARFGRTRGDVMLALRQRGIGTQVHYIPVDHQPYYVARYGPPAALPGAAAYYDATLSLPMYPALTDDDVDLVVESLGAALESESI